MTRLLMWYKRPLDAEIPLHSFGERTPADTLVLGDGRFLHDCGRPRFGRRDLRQCRDQNGQGFPVHKGRLGS
jgi:hypothetical protein